MADWKKVIVSGSTAHLNQITASNTDPLNLPNIQTTSSVGDSIRPLIIDSSSGKVYQATGNSSSFAITASYATTASYAINALSSSYAITSSHLAGTASWAYSASNAESASHASNALTSSHALTASYIDASNIDGQVGFPYSGSDVITGSDAPSPSAAVITGSLVLTRLSGSSTGANITASGEISASKVIAGQYLLDQSSSLAIKTSVVSYGGVDVSQNAIKLGDPNLDLNISSSKGLIIQVSGGVTMSNVPTTTRPPYILAIEDDTKEGTPNVVKIPFGAVGGGTGDLTQTGNITIEGFTTCSDNSNINLTISSSSTEEEEILIGTVYINDLGDLPARSSRYTASFEDSPGSSVILDGPDEILISKASVEGTSYETNPLQSGDKVRIKWFIKPALGSQTTDPAQRIHTTTIKSVDSSSTGQYLAAGTYGWDTDQNMLSYTQDGTNQDDLYAVPSLKNRMSLVDPIKTAAGGESADLWEYFEPGGGERSRPEYTIYKVVDNSKSTLEICLDENLSLNDITQSGDLYFSGSTHNSTISHSIHYAVSNSHMSSNGTLVSESSYLSISASDVDVQNKLKAHTLDATIYQLEGFQFLDIGGASITGSNLFGTSSADTHTFTGSIKISGSNVTIDNGVGQVGFVGTSSWAVSASNAVSASYATSASYALSASFAQDATSASYALSASYAVTASYTETANSASYALSSSYAVTASYTETANSASYALSASYAVTASYTETANSASYASTASYAELAASASNAESASHATNALTASHAINALSASYAENANLEGSNIISSSTQITNFNTFLEFTGDSIISSSIQINLGEASGTASSSISASYAVTASYIDVENIPANVGFPFTGSAGISGSLNVDGPITTTDDLTVEGNLLVKGDHVTLNTKDLAVEDRFIVIGSGSSTVANMDVGIIFETGSIDGKGTALYFNAGANRVSIANGLDDSVGSKQSSVYSNILDHADDSDIGTASLGGHLVTVRHLGFAGTTLVASVDKTKQNNAQFGVGEMAVDSSGDIWVYTDTIALE